MHSTSVGNQTTSSVASSGSRWDRQPSHNLHRSLWRPYPPSAVHKFKRGVQGRVSKHQIIVLPRRKISGVIVDRNRQREISQTWVIVESKHLAFLLRSTQIPTSTRLHLGSQKRVHEPLREADADLRRDGFSVPSGPLSLITLTCGPGALIQPTGTSSYHLHGRTATPQDGSAGHLAAHIARGRHHLHGLDHLHCNSSADIRSISAAGNCRFRLH